MKYIFGPVPSRRLGSSLGIDLLPMKICSQNCLYCECGPTRILTLKRAEWVPTKEVIKELSEFLKNPPKIDYITFSGSGEPTLHSGIGEIIHFLKNNYPYRVAILTNSTLLRKAYSELLEADLIAPSLDAATEEAFKKVNLPHPGLKVEDILEGIRLIDENFRGEIHIEVLLVDGVNDDEKNLEAIANFLKTLKNIDSIQLNTVDRPPAYPVSPINHERLQKIAQFLQKETGIKTEVITRSRAIKEALSRFEVLSTLGRRPMTTQQIAEATGKTVEEAERQLQSLKRKGFVEERITHNGKFWIKKEHSHG